MRLPVNMAPDEYMRYDLTHWIFEHNALPRGDNPEIINELWGYSYGFTPYLSSIISVVFMKLAAICFGASNETAMIVAARMVSVLAGTGTVFLGLKIGNLCFGNRKYGIFYAVLMGMLPQFVFLSSYLNCDSIAVFTVTLILYYWLGGIKKHWETRSCIKLGIAIGLCALSYYFAYAYILCSIFLFFLTGCRDHVFDGKKKILFFRAGIIFLTAFLIAGWFFIRNYILYDGDFLGMEATSRCAEIYAQEEFKPSKHWTYRSASYSILDMLFMSKWIPGTVTSFFAVFGYKTIVVPYTYYIGYLLILCFGIVFFIKTFIGLRSDQRIVFLCGIAACVITVCISIYSSWSRDYQSQGRYIMEILPVLMLMCAYGYQSADCIFMEKWKIHNVSSIAFVIWILMFVRIFIGYCIPLCMGGI